MVHIHVIKATPGNDALICFDINFKHCDALRKLTVRAWTIINQKVPKSVGSMVALIRSSEKVNKSAAAYWDFS